MKRILIADDEPHVVRVLRVALEKAGFEVDSAPHGAAALARINQQTPDALITDIQMPHMTGEELCAQIQEIYPRREFLILVLTSRTEIEHREWSRNITNLLFLEKPVSIRKLTVMLENYFDTVKTTGDYEFG